MMLIEEALTVLRHNVLLLLSALKHATETHLAKGSRFEGLHAFAVRTELQGNGHETAVQSNIEDFIRVVRIPSDLGPTIGGYLKLTARFREACQVNLRSQDFYWTRRRSTSCPGKRLASLSEYSVFETGNGFRSLPAIGKAQTSN